MAADLYYGFVGLLLHGNGADVGTTFTDSSYTPKVPTVNGSTQTSTTITAQFGSASMKFDGTTDYLAYATNVAFGFGTGDYTVEGWIHQANEAVDRCIFENRLGSVEGIAIYSSVGSGTSARRLTVWNTTAEIAGSGSTQFAVNTWQHWAVCRSGTTLRGYVNGEKVWEVTDSRTYASTAAVNIGGTTAGAQGFLGYLDEIRITKGIARYTSPTIVVPTEEFGSWETAIATADLTAPMMTMSAGFGIDVNVSSPAMTVHANFGINADCTSPMMAIDAYFGGVAEIALPMMTLDAAAHDSAGENSVEFALPMMTLAADFGASAAIRAPMMTIDAAMTGTALLQAGIAVPMMTLDAQGTGSPYVLSVAIQIPMVTLAADFGVSVDVVLPMMTVDGRAASGGVFRAYLTIPMMTVDAGVTERSFGRCDITVPMMVAVSSASVEINIQMMAVDAYITAIVAVAYEAYAVNLKHTAEKPVDEVTRYTNMPFNQIVRWGTSYYGAGPTGLYLLGGTTDAGTAITWAVKTAMTDDDTPVKKTVRAVRFGGRVGPAATVTVYPGETSATPYTYTTPRDATVQNYRQKLGRGIKSRYYALGMSGTGVFELDTLEPEVDKMTRKI